MRIRSATRKLLLRQLLLLAGFGLSGALGAETADNQAGIAFRNMGYGGSLCRILVTNRRGESAYITCNRRDGGLFNNDFCEQWIANYGPLISQDVADRMDVGFENGEIIYRNPDGKGNVNIYSLDSLR